MHLIQEAASFSNYLWFLYAKWMPHREINKPVLSCFLINVVKTDLYCVLRCIIALIEHSLLLVLTPTSQSQIFIDARAFSSMGVNLSPLYVPIFEQMEYESL